MCVCYSIVLTKMNLTRSGNHGTCGPQLKEKAEFVSYCCVKWCIIFLSSWPLSRRCPVGSFLNRLVLFLRAQSAQLANVVSVANKRAQTWPCRYVACAHNNTLLRVACNYGFFLLFGAREG